MSKDNAPKTIFQSVQQVAIWLMTGLIGWIAVNTWQGSVTMEGVKATQKGHGVQLQNIHDDLRDLKRNGGGAVVGASDE